MKRIQFRVPFSGFMEGKWTHIADIMHEQGIEMETAAKGLDESEIADALEEFTKSEIFELETAKRMVGHFDALGSERLEFKLGLKFIEIRAGNPIASIDSRTVDKLFHGSGIDGHSKLLTWLAANRRSTSVSKWTKPAHDWSGGLVQSFLCSQIMRANDTFDRLDEDLFYCFDENDWYQVWEASVDWKRYERQLEKMAVD